MKKRIDIIIIGAGLVGTSIALALKKLGLSILILEKNLPTATNTTNSRPISLSYGSHRILKALDIWDALATSACPISSVHVSEKKRFGTTRFTAAEENVPALGYVVPFTKLQNTLYKAANLPEHISVLATESVEKMICDKSGATVEIKTTSGKQTLQANLLIAADGTNSTCRELLHIDTNTTNAGDTAYIYQLTLSKPHNHTAFERFTKLGVLAILPLQNSNTAQLVWTMSPANQNKIANWDEKQILAFLQDTFFERLEINSACKTAEFPLQTIIAEKQVDHSFVLLGNAAHTIYPVAAQGFNLALRDVATLAEIMIDAHQNNQPIGAISTLKKYESAALQNQSAILKMTNSIVALFDFPFIGCARGLGLLATDLIHPIKHKLAKRAMGMAGKLSKIIRDRS